MTEIEKHEHNIQYILDEGHVETAKHCKIRALEKEASHGGISTIISLLP